MLASIAPGLIHRSSRAGEAGSPTPAPVDFERDVAPLLTAHCLRCHQASRREGELSLASPDDLRELGYVVPGQPDESHLLQVVGPGEEGVPRMPKEGAPLSAQQIALVRRWIEAGAAWPEGVELRERSRAGRDWWSLAPLADVQIPSVESWLGGLLPAEWGQHPIDRFVGAELAAHGLAANPPAPRQVLIRRLSYDLTGLPPSPEEVRQFENDPAPDAYERLVDRLLDSPHYGEQWGRHWLDVVRFGESTGFERNTLVNNAWPFRDYVIRALNEDRPISRLITEHLAGDVVGPGNPAIEVGTTFLVAGTYDDVGNQDPVQAALIRANTLDEIIRTTSEAFLGLTVGCARCHDHKFDPITQRDYYGLYAALAGVHHGARDVATPAERAARQERLAPLESRRGALAREIDAVRRAIQDRADGLAAEAQAGWVRPPVDRYGTEEPFSPTLVRQVRLVVESTDTVPTMAANFRLDEFEIWTAGPEPKNVALASRGARAEGASRVAGDFAEAYDPKLAIDGVYGARWLAAGPTLTVTLAEPATIDRIVFSSDRPRGLGAQDPNTLFVGDYRIEVSSDGQVWTEVANSHDRKPVTEALRQWRLTQRATTSDDQVRLDALGAQIAELDAQIRAVPPLAHWWVGQFRDAPGPFTVFLGGDPQRAGIAVSPHGLEVLGDLACGYEQPAEAPESQRRLALAQWITSPDNPLPPRVLANRLWHYHFGRGIVDTPSDLGYMGGRPTHPALLDWLARQVLVHGTRLKPLHRLIVTSQTYRQAGNARGEALAADAESRLLWRYPPRRLTAEQVRDTLLSVAGKLDPTMGGPGYRLYQYLEDNVATYVPLDEHGPETYRRAVYHQNARAAEVDVLSDFDCPDPAFSAPRRAQTTTPLQALTLLNHRFTWDMARALAARLEAAHPGDSAAQVDLAFRLCYCRPPTAEETAGAANVASRFGMTAVARALLNSNELIYVD